MRAIRVAQIGTSRYSHGNEIFGTMKRFPEIFEIVGYAFPEGEKEKFPQNLLMFDGYTELTVEQIIADESIEAVVIETEEVYITKYALMAARAGKHIHMEKPGGVSLENFEELIETVKKNKTVFHTGYMYRYNPAIKSIMERVKNGEIGEIVSVEAQMGGFRGEEQTGFLKAFPGGMMFFLGCHLIDLVLQFQGAPKSIVSYNKTSGRYDTDAKDFSMAVFEYDRGVSFVKTTQAEMGGFSRRQLVITGTKGKFEVRPLERSIQYPLQYTEYIECMSEDWDDCGKLTRTEEHDRYEAMLFAFAQMVRGEKENPYTYDYELSLFKTILKCCE